MHRFVTPLALVLMAGMAPTAPLSAQTPAPTVAAATPPSPAPETSPLAQPSPSMAPATSVVDSDEPPAKKPGVRLQFVPPPMEGTISLGIYDSAGKLVRTLHREAEPDGGDFVVANDGLVTAWDGRDDSGKPVPAGTYSAHGWLVGDLKVKGEAILGNDWMTDDDSPRIAEIERLSALPDGGFGLEAKLSDGSSKNLSYHADGSPAPAGAMSNTPGADHSGLSDLKLPGVMAAIATCMARDGGVWVVDRDASGVSVKQFAPDGSFKRHLAIDPADPQPEQIAASPVEDVIYLLERNAQGQRLRALRLVSDAAPGASPAPTVSAETKSVWKILWQKAIWNLSNKADVLARLKFPNGHPFIAQDTALLALMKNPMDQDEPGKLSVTVGIESKGSCLNAADGLVLGMISDTPHLQWVAMARDPDGKGLLIYQTDGAAVEEFRITHPEQIMPFDGGELDWKP
ncbi:MAG: FlgD immunoglobulin-like domain containing protein [Chthoniobacteraceae bacterium]